MALPTFVWISPTTLAKTSSPFDATDSGSIVVSADTLAGGETVGLFVVAGATNVVVADLQGNPIILTPILPAVCLEGGASYVFVKSATAALCGVYVVAKRT